MNRRSVLQLGGVALAGIAGCTGSPEFGTPVVDSTDPDEPTPTRTPLPGPKQGDDLPSDESPDDGYPPQFSETPPEREIDTSSFEPYRQNGVDVPLVPVDATYYWYARGEARFVDARSERAYESSHVYGAVLSPAPDGREDDPVSDWPTGDRIVCYCGCPHHLSSMRAASLIEDGYEEVYVIDEGFWDEGWNGRGYPIAGTDVQSRPAPWAISGLTDASFAGDTAWARHPESGQREAGPIGDDGRFELELRFIDVTADSRIEVETPGYRVEASLGTLSSGIVTGDR